jgi:hypothetical protein
MSRRKGGVCSINAGAKSRKKQELHSAKGAVQSIEFIPPRAEITAFHEGNRWYKNSIFATALFTFSLYFYYILRFLHFPSVVPEYFFKTNQWRW